ncbi:MAG: glycoside hydrolase, partial [Planctomycetes bacterium]|nr:glycoside hydrolase [Planctomycetota bacterium]
RVSGRRPEIWDPVTGRIRAATDFRQSEGRTIVPLRLPPFGSVFVVFREPIGARESGAGAPNFPESVQLAELTGPWTVRFDPEWGGPRESVFERLIDWTEHPSSGVRYYSGTATYEKTFDLPATRAGGGDRICLDVGDVREMARVRLNGRDCGIIWTPPFEIDITEAVRATGNRLEIEVVNQWTNRLVGDERLPPGERRTRTNITRITKDSPLLPSGLLGPVTIRVVRASD